MESDYQPVPEREERPSRQQALPWGLTLALIFAVGLLAGYAGRPLVTPDRVVEVVITATPGPEPTAVAAAPGGAPTPTIMEFVLSDARHFQGSEGAPVTIVEFSDFK